MIDWRPTQLNAHLASGDRPLLLDVREPWEFDICRIADSVLIPLGQLAQRTGELPTDGTLIVVICHHGIRSRFAAGYLENHGFPKVVNLSGGVEAWAREVDIHMATY